MTNTKTKRMQVRGALLNLIAAAVAPGCAVEHTREGVWAADALAHLLVSDDETTPEAAPPMVFGRRTGKSASQYEIMTALRDAERARCAEWLRWIVESEWDGGSGEAVEIAAQGIESGQTVEERDPLIRAARKELREKR